MRTVILLGLLTIADCINPTKFTGYSGAVMYLFSIVFTAAVVMDVADFLLRR
jgi:hypothetical protein